MLLDRCASSPTRARPAAGHFGGRLGEVPGGYPWLGLSGAAFLGPPQVLRDVGPVRLSPKRSLAGRLGGPQRGGTSIRRAGLFSWGIRRCAGGPPRANRERVPKNCRGMRGNPGHRFSAVVNEFRYGYHTSPAGCCAPGDRPRGGFHARGLIAPEPRVIGSSAPPFPPLPPFFRP